jgi:hypothetical protein
MAYLFEEEKHNTAKYIARIIPILIVVMWLIIIYHSICKSDEQKPQQESAQQTSESIYIETSETEEPSYTYYDIPLSVDFQCWITDLCRDSDFTPEIIYGIMYVESRFQNINSENNNYCGYMQIANEYFDYYIDISQQAYKLFPEEVDINNPKANVIAALSALEKWKKVCDEKGYPNMDAYLETYNKGYTYFSMSKKSTTYANKVYEFINSLNDKKFILQQNK